MMISLNNVTKTFGAKKVIDSISLDIPSNKIIGIKGINGSGKTMLLRLIAGFIKPSAGTIFINGECLWKEIEMPRSMGVLLEKSSLLDNYSGLENLELLYSLQQAPDISYLKYLLDKVDLGNTAKLPYKKYSLGMKQRLGIAAAVMFNPKLLLLDEPTNGLDEEGVYILKDIIHEQVNLGATVIMTSHDACFLETMSDEVHLIHSGRISL